MSSSNRGVLGTIFTFILGILVGFVLLIGGVAGGAYWAYNNLQLKKVNEYANMDIIGENYLNSTLKQLVDEITALSKDPEGLTLGKLEEVFAIVGKTIDKKYPDGIIPVKLSGVTFVEVDLNALRSIALKSLGSNAASAINFVATLDALTTMGINLPNLPLIQGSEGVSGKECYVYTLATEDETHEKPFDLKKNYKNATELYKLQSDYILASDPTTGDLLKEHKWNKTLYISNGTDYVLATAEDGTKLPEYASETSFYVLKDNYVSVDLATIGTEKLYIRTDGIKALPIIDAFNALSSMLNFETMTLKDLETKMGINLKEGTGEDAKYNFIFESIINVPINKMSSQITDEIKNFKLVDLIEDDGSVLIKSLLYQDDKTTPVKVGEISSRINTLTLGNIVDITTDSPKILQALKDSTLSNLSTKINDLTLDDVMTPSGALANLIYKRDTDGNKIPLYYTDATQTETTTEVTAFPAGFVKTKITEISGQINYLTIGEFLPVEPDSSAILKALADTQIQNLDAKIKTLTMQEIFASDIYNGFDIIKASGVTLDYATYGFKNFYTDAAGTTKVTDVFNADHSFNTTYTNTVLYSEKVADSMWKFFVMDNSVEQEVKILDMGARMNNIAANIRNASLFELKANGLITTNQTTLEATINIPFDPSNPNNGKKIGQLTMEELIELMASALTT